ncbi:MAG: hypothetical protein H5U21_06245 [Porphyrobacter sp.]|nr:hypothetical protein [Porphyrobacter sp.]
MRPKSAASAACRFGAVAQPWAVARRQAGAHKRSPSHTIAELPISTVAARPPKRANSTSATKVQTDSGCSRTMTTLPRMPKVRLIANGRRHNAEHDNGHDPPRPHLPAMFSPGQQRAGAQRIELRGHQH